MEKAEGPHNRRSFLRFMGLVGCALPLTAHRSWSRRVNRIGFLNGDVPSLTAAFRDELQKLGYVDGKNLVVEMRISRPNTSDLVTQAGELARMDVDLIVAAALPQALEVRRANPAMPMVIATCPGMVSNGFANSIEHPGGHYTGMDELPPGVTAKRLELLRIAVPKITSIALLSTTPGRGGHETQLAEAERAASRFGIAVKPYRAASLSELEAALLAVVKDRMEALVNFQGGLSIANRQRIVDFVSMHHLPAIYQSTLFVETGGLMAWSPDQEEQFRVAARYVDQILKGVGAGDLPVRYPDRYYLSINARTARQLGLVLPSALLAQADRVLQ